MQYVEVARARSDRGELVLRQRSDPDAGDGAPTVLERRVNGVYVMDSAETSSEIALARTALELTPAPGTVLVGGLGLGFTAHEVLADARVEHVVLAEIEECLVTWFRDGTVPHGPAYLADERLTVTVADVRQLLAEARPDSFGLVLLDVDNGPDFLVHEQNAAIYEAGVLQQAWQALAPDGVLVVWSSTEAPALGERLRDTFEETDVRPLPVLLQGREETYWLHCAHKRSAHKTAHPTTTHHTGGNP
jgi:spermidine synthase